jgi:transposase
MQSGVPTKRPPMLRENLMADKPIVGIDVSKDWLDIATAGGSTQRIDNAAEAIGAWLDRTSPNLVAFEPTGGYERALIAALRERGILFVRVHPNTIVAYRKSRGIKAKTDRIDARLIAAFAAEELTRRGLRPTIAGDEALKELAARRRQLVAAIHAERCRLALAAGRAVRQSLELVIDALKESLGTLEAEIARHLDADPEAKNLAHLLQSLRGVGPVVAMTLIADLPELGHLSGKEIAALVGLAPQTRQSGKSDGRGRTGHGRPAVRAVLFNAARSAISRPSLFRTFYDHLVTDNRRPGKVALVAIMRKLLVTANAIARDRQPWRGAA